jgi:hypothetical protein
MKGPIRKSLVKEVAHTTSTGIYVDKTLKTDFVAEYGRLNLEGAL